MDFLADSIVKAEDLLAVNRGFHKKMPKKTSLALPPNCSISPKLNDVKHIGIHVEYGISISNPVAGMSQEEAMRIARQMDEGTYVGPWESMSGEQFLAWWRASNGR